MAVTLTFLDTLTHAISFYYFSSHHPKLSWTRPTNQIAVLVPRDQKQPIGEPGWRVKETQVCNMIYCKVTITLTCAVERCHRDTPELQNTRPTRPSFCEVWILTGTAVVTRQKNALPIATVNRVLETVHWVRCYNGIISAFDTDWNSQTSRAKVSYLTFSLSLSLSLWGGRHD